MGLTKVFISVLLALVVFNSVTEGYEPSTINVTLSNYKTITFNVSVDEAIRCYTCTNVDSNKKCRRLEKCARSSDGCQNTVRIENGLILISKGCQQISSCRTNSRQNTRQCSTIEQTLKKSDLQQASQNLPPSVCRSCCTTDRCNAQLYLKVASRTPSTKTWRDLRPTIRNVRITPLNSDTALITFIDRKNHTASFFNFRTTPYSGRIKFTPVFATSESIPGVNHKIPKNSLAYIATGLNAGKRYRLTIVSREKKYFFQHKVFTPFITRPRPPHKIGIDDVDVDSITVHVSYPRQNRGDRFSTFSVSYRKASDRPSAARRLTDYNRPDLKRIDNLEPSTEYVIEAWTNVADSQGRLIATSEKINTTVFTDVPPITNLETREVHATNITWTFQRPQFAPRRSQEEFVIHVRDNTNQLRIIDTVVPATQRSFTATGLTPQTAYSIRINARANDRDSLGRSTKPVFTLIRCYACADSSSHESCNQYIECPVESGGCLNEVRRRSFSQASESGWYRATLKCKQVKACNNSELQDNTMQCNPDRNRNVDPPDVCRCCCEGDLCNGPGGNCGHILGWLTPFQAPPQAPTVIPPFCSDPEIVFGEATCTNEREIGSVCTYRCLGETYLSGAARVTCLDDGKWSPELPQCLPSKICPELPETDGTFYNCTKGFRSGSKCTVECSEGFLIVGDPILRCLPSGSWNQKFTPTCLSENNCQPDPCYNGATCHDGVNDYECECVLGWTGKDCEKEVICEALEAPDNGQLQCTDGNRYTSRCRYSCDYGYEQHGSSFTRCLADGYWSAFEPTVCVIKTCPVPPLRLVNNGRTECTGFGLDDTCHFTCPRGLTVAGGPENITCRPDETWSGNIPCCDLPCPPHAKVDLYFLLDSSSSVGAANWDLLTNFTVGLLNEFVVGPTDMVVGVGRYNRRFDTDSEISFGDYKSYEELKEKISAMPYDGTGTRTGKALRHVYEHSLRTEGNRKDVPDVLVVITDGKSQDNPGAIASFIKKRSKATIYAVGVRNQFHRLDAAQLMTMATSNENVHIMDNGYEQLVREFKDTLAREVCSIPCQYQYEQRELFLRQRQLSAMTGDELDAAFWSEFDANNNGTTTAAPSVSTPKPSGPDAGNARPPIPVEPEIDETPNGPIEENSIPLIPREPEPDNSRPFIEEEV